MTMAEAQAAVRETQKAYEQALVNRALIYCQTVETELAARNITRGCIVEGFTALGRPTCGIFMGTSIASNVSHYAKRDYGVRLHFIVKRKTVKDGDSASRDVYVTALQASSLRLSEGGA